MRMQVEPRRWRATRGVAVILVLGANAGCAINSDGSVTAGFRGSVAWLHKAPPSDIDHYYTSMPDKDLCWGWLAESRDTPSRLPRQEILQALRKEMDRRELTPDACRVLAWPGAR